LMGQIDLRAPSAAGAGFNQIEFEAHLSILPGFSGLS
jgi:hypothetical protein